MDEFEQELKNDFLNEASELLVSAEGAFMKLESEPQNSSLVDAIFRLAHNLKGTSRAVGFGQIAELTHTAENLLLKIKQAQLQITPYVVDVLLRFNDKVLEMVDGLKKDLTCEFEISHLVNELEAASRGESPVNQEEDLTQTEISQPEEIVIDQTPSATSFEDEQFQEMEVSRDNDSQSSSVSIDPSEGADHNKSSEGNVIPLQQTIKVPPKSESVKSEGKKDDETIRVSLARLDKLGDLVGELVILQSAVERALNKDPGELKTSRSLAKICKDIQEMSMSLRMVPVAGAFQKLQRIVRDTTKALGKKVELRLIGEDTEIDRTVLEHLGDPLVHLIRNAVDHGIELPQDRVSQKKGETGIVEVMAFHEGSNLVIQITDDGKGMSTDHLISKAKEKGILRKDQTLGEQEALNLIFHPGFSTKEVVSEVSGRGVGMDVVKTNIESLGGEIRLASKFGLGSSIRLMLPLTLAIIDGILVLANHQQWVIPRNQIHEINRLDKKKMSKVAGQLPIYELRNEVLPLFFLADEIGKSKQEEKIVLIVRTGSIAYAVAVEDVLRQQQVVVKPATLEAKSKSGIMGATILGDGMPALIVDLIEMFKKNNSKNKKAV